MDWTAAIALLAIACQTVSTIFHLWLDWKKSQEPPKDEAWETATRICHANDNAFAGYDFFEIYRDLRFIQEHFEEIKDFRTLEQAKKDLRSKH